MLDGSILCFIVVDGAAGPSINWSIEVDWLMDWGKVWPSNAMLNHNKTFEVRDSNRAMRGTVENLKRPKSKS